MLAIVIPAISAFVLANAQPSLYSFDCSSFWPFLLPGEENTIVDQCWLYPGFPKAVGTTKLIFAHARDSTVWADELYTVSLLLHDAVFYSVYNYGNYSTPPDIVFILTNPRSGSAALSANAPAGPTGPCQIIAGQPWLARALSARRAALQEIARAVYQCVQQVSINMRAGHASQWLMDGSATYFSNLAYPNTNAEWLYYRNYHPLLPIYLHTHAYADAPGLYFQSLEMTRGPAYIGKFVTNTVPSYSAPAERRRLSGVDGITDDFFGFAKRYLISLKLVRDNEESERLWEDGIVDTNGQPIPLDPSAMPEPSLVSFAWDAAGASGIASIQTVPFTVKEFTLLVVPRQIASFGANFTKKQRLSIRETLLFPNTWRDIPWSEVWGECESTAAVRLLFVSTNDVEVDETEINVTYRPRLGC
jgi:hypothetical protein